MKTDAKLVGDLREAAAVAVCSVDRVEDGGTCNFDAPVLYVGRKYKAAEAAIEEAGGSSFRWNGGLVLSGFGFPGQANRRTRAAETMKQLLVSKGYQVGMYYQMD
jgi:hypothetical protein